MTRRTLPACQGRPGHPPSPTLRPRRQCRGLQQASQPTLHTPGEWIGPPVFINTAYQVGGEAYEHPHDIHPCC